jgi:hypothetical protein
MKTDLTAAAAARELRARLAPDRVLMAGPSYDNARRIWNGAVDHRPALIVRPGRPARCPRAPTARTPNGYAPIHGSRGDGTSHMTSSLRAKADRAARCHYTRTNQPGDTAIRGDFPAPRQDRPHQRQITARRKDLKCPRFHHSHRRQAECRIGLRARSYGPGSHASTKPGGH